jgi:hypothetical protein
MKAMASILLTLFACYALSGCSNHSNHSTTKSKTQSKEETIQTALAKLSPEDRKLAEAQKFCAVETTSRLGSMDTPVKIMLDGEPVFLCCDHCEAKAKKDKEATLKTVRELKAAPK